MQLPAAEGATTTAVDVAGTKGSILTKLLVFSQVGKENTNQHQQLIKAAAIPAVDIPLRNSEDKIRPI